MSLLCSTVVSLLKTKVKILSKICKVALLAPDPDDIYCYPATQTCHTVPQTQNTYSSLKAPELATSARNAPPADFHMAGSVTSAGL